MTPGYEPPTSLECRTWLGIADVLHTYAGPCDVLNGTTHRLNI